jgi:hypothetical protein
MTWDGEIQAATIDQIVQGRDGKIHIIDADAGGVVARLKRIDPNLCVRWSEAGDYYVVYYNGEDGPELVATYQELDQRIAADIERINWENRQPGYSFADELEKRDAEAEKRFEKEQFEKTAEHGEELAFHLREATGRNDHKIFVGKDVKD